MKLIDTEFPEVKIIVPALFEDSRGFFQESYNRRKFEELGISDDFVQDNHSFSKKRGTIRGLHFQSAPFSQSKLIRVAMGRILDIVVDIRKDSPYFGKYVEFELSEDNHKQVYIPKGFAHGFCTLTDNCHVVYKVDNYYSAENNCGIIWNDPDIGVDWPENNPVLSEQDKLWGKLHDNSRN